MLSWLLESPTYSDPAFWLGIFIGLLSVSFSLAAFSEARRAKNAAQQAGRVVKVQTIIIEMTEISQRLDKLDVELDFGSARDLLNEVTRRLRRLIAPFQDASRYRNSCAQLKDELESAKAALEELGPEANDSERAVYFGIQGHLASISAQVSELLGLFEAETIESPDE